MIQAALLLVPGCREAIWQGCLHLALSVAGVALASRREAVMKPCGLDTEVQTEVDAYKISNMR